MAGVAGAVVGAALPTPAYRLSVEWKTPARTACASCDAALSTGAGSGWLRFGARCPACGARNGPRTWLLAVVVALGCAGMVFRFGVAPSAWPYLAVIPLGCLLAAIDIACLRLPELLVLPGIGGSLVGFATVALCTGAWGALLRAGLGGLALGGAYLVLALLPGGQLGLGDVTLAVMLGVYLGWLGWPFVLFGAVLPFLVNAPIVLGMLVARRVGRRSSLPFGPAMLVGAYLAVVGPGLVTLFIR